MFFCVHWARRRFACTSANAELPYTENKKGNFGLGGSKAAKSRRTKTIRAQTINILDQNHSGRICRLQDSCCVGIRGNSSAEEFTLTDGLGSALSSPCL